MARQEINIFGTSFLDLLSGALAAVIILFIIVPKMTSEQQNTLQEIERMNVQVEELETLMEQVRHSVPQELFEEIQAQMEELRNTAAQLREQVERLQQQVAATESENQRLREELEQRRNVEQQNQQLQQRLRELEARLEQQQQQTQGQGISDGKVFGMDAELGIVCIWPENVDVDLYVKDLATGAICYFGAKSHPFGALMEDITSRTSPNDDRYELFYQKRIVPGTYEVYVSIYSGNNHPWDGTPAHVDGYVVMNPGKRNQTKIPYRSITLTQAGQKTTVGILTVTANSISLQQ